MRAAVITFPGSNCDEDLQWALTEISGIPADLVAATATTLTGYDAVFLPGGFSYGDYLRSGAIARFSPIMTAVKKFAAAGGFVVGICNGFQILTEAGLLPGTLQWNTSLHFICAPAPLEIVNSDTPFTNAYPAGTTITLPIAHGQGNYYADPATLAALETNHQIIFRYTDNPNGSVHDIAGITNAAGNVLGMMPHPERAMETLLGSIDGRGVFQSLIHAMEGAGSNVAN
ncbi:phosphoribosylformylglycinamidine synthase subunit PurQ [Schleiferilactobacillus perolens]|jgi:phosphoribosylformylglycinamidine synthase|uniref:phosphoribosylformylglycinamidine synthase subunit PurQ n=1 Tax=Schleiferilactobacillus perolens TaxID=100468 RepID=UPI0023545831|nr:phosphoribosylformylglycinamidine synthase subunit PurQ [Schleiferilactobacillus perolens]MCI2172430.1 phosphoribosylformylglycinamidine synthase subunit PurQ [Schleiferilactobacillus perolens]